MTGDAGAPKGLGYFFSRLGSRVARPRCLGTFSRGRTVAVREGLFYWDRKEDPQ